MRWRTARRQSFGHHVAGCARVGAQVGGVAGEERRRGLVGLDEPLQDALQVLDVAEGMGRLFEQGGVERAEAVGQRAGQTLRVEVLGQLRAPQGQDEGEELLEAFLAQSEKPGVDGKAGAHLACR